MGKRIEFASPEHFDLLERKMLGLYQIREAAKRVCWFDWSDNDPDAVAAIEQLRSALTSTLGTEK